ncbi:MAG TPA: GNAT family N-acetyltransferase [Chitinophagaceae bacterium]|nr:GNAT family N-acetyltransferase [Chitinophagaceae bacterium]
MISPACFDDIPELVSLINSAYRGDDSRKGWTTEADLLDGDLRTDVESLLESWKNPNGVILKFVSAERVIGCVYLEKQGNKLYLGMLSVSPTAQGEGVGKKLLTAAEEYAKEHHCKAIVMTVISLRHELIAWYERHGYRRNGETRPFPNDEKFGVAKQPLEFSVLEKSLG